MQIQSTSAGPLPPPPPARGGGENRHFGTLRTGETVREYTFTNANGLRFSVIPYGAIVTQLHVPDRHGQLADIVCGFNDLDGYLAGHPYFGCIAGRVAGRITGGRFTLDGRQYELAINDSPNHLHGGHVGFDKRLWTVDEVLFDGIRLTLTSPDGEEGYPGTVRVAVVYRLTDDNALVVDYEATTDKPTPLSLTHHGYFNLSGEGSGRIDNHVLQIHAADFAPADAQMGLLGGREPVAGRPNDFKRPKRLGDAIPGLWKQHGDVYFIDRKANGLMPVAMLADPHSGRVMRIDSTEPCLQLYTGMGLDGSLVGKSGKAYQPFGAVCLEAERYPDGVNSPSLGDIILRPGQTYRQTTVHRFSIA